VIRIAIIGKSGCGKSTIANKIKDEFYARGLTIDIIKFAKPLYDIQYEIYQQCGIAIEYSNQNQILLESIAEWMRQIDHKSLAQNFIYRLLASSADVVINDDVRDTATDIPTLISEGFVFIKVVCDESIRNDRLRLRNDLSVVVNSKTTEKIDSINTRFVIDNSNQTEALLANITAKIVKQLIEENKK
jgi:dephospho-CoA kinase